MKTKIQGHTGHLNGYDYLFIEMAKTGLPGDKVKMTGKLGGDRINYCAETRESGDLFITNFFRNDKMIAYAIFDAEENTKDSEIVYGVKP